MDWTLTTAAAEWGIDRKTLEKRMRAQGWEIVARAKYHTRDITAAIVGDLEAERIRKTREEADKIALANARERKELITTGEARDIYRRPLEPIARAIKDMPSRLGNRVNPADPILARSELEEFSRDLCEKVRKLCLNPQQN